MTVRKTIKWMLIIVCLVGLSGGGGVYWLCTRSDEMLRQKIRDKIAEIAPEWDVEIGRARFDWLSRRHVHIYDFHLKAKGHSTPIATLPKIVLTVDMEKLWQPQPQIVVHKIHLFAPQLELTRDQAGRWNWQDLLPLPKSYKSCPEWEIQRGTVRIHLAQPGGGGPSTIDLRETDVQLIPSGKRKYVVQGQTQIQQVGKLTVKANWNVDAKTWSLDGKMHDVAANDQMLAFAATTSPELRASLARGQAALLKLTRTSQRPATSAGAVHFGVGGTLDIDFHISRPQPDAEPKFKLLFAVRQGQFSNPALPFPLHDVSGKFYCDNQRILVRNVIAKNGITRLHLDGEFTRRGPTMAGWFRTKATEVILDKRLQERLPRKWRKFYDPLQASGQVDVEGTLIFDGHGNWQRKGFLLTAKGCRCAHNKFPYPMTGIVGTVKQTKKKYEVKFTGLAGRRPVSITGYVKNLGPAAEVVADIHVDQLPLDETFLASCLPTVQKTLKVLNFKGLADAHYRLFRPAGLNQKFQFHLAGRVRRGSLEYEHFPYRLSNLSGLVTYNSVGKTWRFRHLKAVHGAAQLSGQGVFSNKDGPELLELAVTAKGAQLDKQLEMALPEEVQTVWNQLSPTGKLNLETEISWTPGQPPRITLPTVEIYDAGIVMKPFPYPLNDVRAKFSYADDHIEIESFSGNHDDTEVRARGFAKWDADGNWTVRLVQLYADDLVPNRLFRRTLPEDLRSAIEELNPRHPLSLSGMLEFRGNPRSDDVSAAWDLEFVLSGNSLSAGIDLENVSGRVTVRGTWDGQRVSMTQGNRVDLDSAYVWGYQLTQVRGPYQIKDRQLTVGSEKAFAGNAQPGVIARIPHEERLTARAIGGLLTFDAQAKLKPQTPYHIKMTMWKGDLEAYARRYLRGQTTVRGLMNGWIDLHGRGSSPKQVTGSGQLRISPAALYELPIMAQIFKVLSFVPPDKTAFTYALLNFNVGGGQFRFNSIDLAGDAISLHGEGTAKFDGQLNLNFYSRLPRQRLLPLPAVNFLVGEATKGWMGIEVRGKVGATRAAVKPVPQLDEALKRILGAFDARSPSAIPRLVISPLIPQQWGSSPRSDRPRPSPRRR